MSHLNNFMVAAECRRSRRAHAMANSSQPMELTSFDDLDVRASKTSFFFSNILNKVKNFFDVETQSTHSVISLPAASASSLNCEKYDN